MIVEGDCVEAMAAMDEASVDAIVCDPPYGIGFMGKEWDGPQIARAAQRDKETRRDLGPHSASRPGRADSRSSSAFGNAANYAGPVRAGREWQGWCETWATEALRILKPGGHLLAFGGTRTYHRLACAVEDAGFEIRDSLIWIYGSGFPKSLDVSKAIDKAAGAEQWQGWGTALKPAHEPIVVARKPLSGTVAQNVSEHGTGALNVDGCRVGAGEDRVGGGPRPARAATGGFNMSDLGERPMAGRWPANVTLSHLPECERVGTRRVKSQNPEYRRGVDQAKVSRTADFAMGPREPNEGIGYADPDGTETIPSYNCAPGCPVAELDRQSGELTSGRLDRSRIIAENKTYGNAPKVREGIYEADTGGASRFFYCAKASRGERNAGLDGFEERATRGNYGDGIQDARPHTREGYTYEAVTRNVHPTVKPIDLMRWLVRLVTPPGGTVLDPFTGSGTTGVAATLEGVDFIGCELDPEYAEIAKARIEWWSQFPPGTDLASALGLEAVDRVHREAGQIGLFG